jgi:hypothetical protein
VHAHPSGAFEHINVRRSSVSDSIANTRHP